MLLCLLLPWSPWLLLQQLLQPPQPQCRRRTPLQLLRCHVKTELQACCSCARLAPAARSMQQRDRRTDRPAAAALGRPCCPAGRVQLPSAQGIRFKEKTGSTMLHGLLGLLSCSAHRCLMAYYLHSRRTLQRVRQGTENRFPYQEVTHKNEVQVYLPDFG